MSIRFAICNETYQGWPLERVCEHAKGVGYEGLELAPFTLCDDPAALSEERAAHMGATIRAAGLQCVGLHWLLLQPPGLHLTSSSVGVRKKTSSFVQHLVRLCAALEGEVLVWGSPAQRSFPPEQSREDAFGNAADVLAEICAVAEEVGVTVALEPLAPELTNFLNTAEETVELIRRVQSPACRLHLDVYAMSTESRSIPELVRTHRSDLAHFHANDPNLRGPGFGDMDYAPIAGVLKEVGYDGWVSVEVFDYEPGPEVIAEQSLAYLKGHFGTA